LECNNEKKQSMYKMMVIWLR